MYVSVRPLLTNALAVISSCGNHCFCKLCCANDITSLSNGTIGAVEYDDKNAKMISAIMHVSKVYVWALTPSALGHIEGLHHIISNLHCHCHIIRPMCGKVVQRETKKLGKFLLDF